MKTSELKVKVTFIEPILATNSGNAAVQEEFIAMKAPDAEKTKEELEALPKEEQIEKASTVFVKDDKGLFLWDYQWRGYLKENIGALIELGEVTGLSKWTYKRAVDQCIFVIPRRIHFMREGKHIMKPDGSLQRPLRATTMQGDRVALARSEQINAGATMELMIRVFESSNAKSNWKNVNQELVIMALQRGEMCGHGQWRSGGFGRFTFDQVK